MISPNIIAEISKKENVSWGTVEKDYFITLLLDAITHEPLLWDNFVFKGGTCLRKAFFEHYRYSEDLDFTLRKKLTTEEIKGSIENALDFLKTEYNADFRIKGFNSKHYFTDVKVQFVGFKGNKNTIALDLSGDEVLLGSIKEKLIFNPYYAKDFFVSCYSLEEMFGEKLRALLQRTRVRDYYDVWYLLKYCKANLNLDSACEIFKRKASYKKVNYENKAQLLDATKMEQAKAYYESQLGNQLANLPPFETIENDLKKAINNLPL